MDPIAVGSVTLTACEYQPSQGEPSEPEAEKFPTFLVRGFIQTEDGPRLFTREVSLEVAGDFVQEKHLDGFDLDCVPDGDVLQNLYSAISASPAYQSFSRVYPGRNDWRKVAQGLWRLKVAFILSVTSGFLAGCAGGLQGSGGELLAEEAALLAWFSFALGLFSAALTILGRAQCSAVPEVSGARGMAGAAISLTILSVVLQVLVGLLSIPISQSGRSSGAIPVLALLIPWVGSSLLAEITFLLFLGRVGKYLDDQNTIACFQQVVTIVAFVPVSLLVPAVLLPLRSPIAFFTGILIVLVALGLLVYRYFTLLEAARCAIARSLERLDQRPAHAPLSL
jgi:hypothetical protein